MKLKHAWAHLLILTSVLAIMTQGYAESGSRPIGTSTTANQGQAKLWFNDDAWWAILPFDGDATTPPGNYFYKLEGGVFVRHALVDTHITTRTDILWNGTYLFALAYQDANSLPTRLYKYSYNTDSHTYTLLPGFPVALRPKGNPGSDQTAATAQNSTDKLRAPNEANDMGATTGKSRVTRSTSADPSGGVYSGDGPPATREQR